MLLLWNNENNSVSVDMLSEASRGYVLNIKNYPYAIRPGLDWSDNPSVLLFGWWKHPTTQNKLLCGINLKKLGDGEIDILKTYLPNIMSKSGAYARYWAARRALAPVLPHVFMDYRKGGAYATWRHDRIGSVTTNLIDFRKPQQIPDMEPPSEPPPSPKTTSKKEEPKTPQSKQVEMPKQPRGQDMSGIQPQYPKKGQMMPISDIIPPDTMPMPEPDEFELTQEAPVPQPAQPAPAGAKAAPAPPERREPTAVHDAQTIDDANKLTSAQRRKSSTNKIEGGSIGGNTINGPRGSVFNRLKKKFGK